ncbi:hypothetical protein BC833DRAFT_588685 [Globomyces pollinis-pini]|nr:hypothetical protein BC833DRAFT_588685 [Globomyces pollinis-pini]
MIVSDKNLSILCCILNAIIYLPSLPIFCLYYQRPSIAYRAWSFTPFLGLLLFSYSILRSLLHSYETASLISQKSIDATSRILALLAFCGWFPLIFKHYCHSKLADVQQSFGLTVDHEDHYKRLTTEKYTWKVYFYICLIPFIILTALASPWDYQAYLNDQPTPFISAFNIILLIFVLLSNIAAASYIVHCQSDTFALRYQYIGTFLLLDFAAIIKLFDIYNPTVLFDNLIDYIEIVIPTVCFLLFFALPSFIVIYRKPIVIVEDFGSTSSFNDSVPFAKHRHSQRHSNSHINETQSTLSKNSLYDQRLGLRQSQRSIDKLPEQTIPINPTNALENILTYPDLAQLFINYLANDQGLENLQFLLDIKKYRQLATENTNNELIIQTRHAIIEQYLSPKSKQLV